MMMPGREYQAQPSRFGFNGKENDNEVKGFGNEQDYGMRIYDVRIGKFLSEDPISVDYPELSPYQFASNSPIANIDLDGLEAYPSEKENPLRVVPKEPGRVIPLNPNKNSAWGNKLNWLRDKLKPLIDKIKNFRKPTPTLPLRPGAPIPVPHDDPNGQPVPISIRKPYSNDPKPGDTKMPQKTPEGSPGTLPQSDPDADGDEESNRDKPVYIYRGMKSNSFNFPMTGESARLLGVRPNTDIEIQNGYVYPNTGGASASISPAALPAHRKPFEYGGTSNDPLFKIDVRALGPALIYKLDFTGSTHGTIQPKHKMTYEQYKIALELTQVLWRKM